MNYLEGTANLVAVCCGCALLEPDRNAPHILTFALSHLKRLCHRIVKVKNTTTASTCSTLATTQAMIGQLANLPCRHSEYITDVMTGRASGLVVQLVALIVLGFMLLDRSEGTDMLEITEMNGHSRGEFQMAKRQRKESEKNLLVKYDPHRDHLVQQYKTVLVRHGNGKATPDDADFTAVAEATYGTIHASPDIHHDKVLAALKALSKDDLFKQSKAVGRKWWGQSGGKGKRTATVLRADFKAALAKTTADAAAASEGEL